MNITEALNAALPDIPAQTMVHRYPRMDPGFTFREHLEEGERIFRVYVPSAGAMYKFPPQNWALVQLFDGKRSYEDIAVLYSRLNGIHYNADAIREFADELEAIDFWYKTPQEKNILLMQKSGEERQKQLKAKTQNDLSLYAFPAANPDKFLTWLVRYTNFIYTPWFTVLTLAAFAFTAYISISRWSEIGSDTLEFYNFSHKSWGDFILFYVLATFALAFHEIGHGHACKHYGARVPAMGFALIYLAPAFYTDTTEGEVQGTRYQRLVISVAGVWAELLIYAVATPIWWNTPPDTLVHNAAYDAMLITGITAALINWNPLIKLDGYHIVCETLGIVDLKEASTAFVSAWVKRHIWGLPVEVPYVPKRRRLGFAVYALLSGLYSYTILYIVARWVGNIFRNYFNSDWSFIPELATAGLIFRSRIRMLVNFMKFVYLDKKDRIRAWFSPRRSLAVAAALAMVLFLPLRHDFVSGRFVLEPSSRAVVRAVVPGLVTRVYVDEGQSVSAGAPLVQLSNLALQSSLAHTQADFSAAASRARSVALHYGNLGPASNEVQRLAQKTRQLSAEAANLELNSPISGVVLTPRVSDRLGSAVAEGTDLIEVVDTSSLRARIYVSEYDLYKLQVGSAAAIQVDGTAGVHEARTQSISPISSEIDPGLAGQSKYQGMRPPNFYLAEILVSNDAGFLKPGMSGNARIYGRRRSLGAFLWQDLANFVGRKAW